MSIEITFTFFGTDICLGEKFKIPLTPDFTSASAVSWAALPGTVIIAVWIFLFARELSFLISSTIIFPIFLPTFLGSTSKAVTILKLYSLKPGYAKTAEPRFPTPTKAVLWGESSFIIFFICFFNFSSLYPTPGVPKSPKYEKSFLICQWLRRFCVPAR